MHDLAKTRRFGAATRFLRIVVAVLLTGSALGAFYPATPALAANNTLPLPAPNWWNGTCDGNRWANVGVPASQLPSIIAQWNGLIACGPADTPGTLPSVQETAPLSLNWEWQCVELSERYLYQRFGLPQQQLSGGSQVVDVYWSYLQAHSGAAPLTLVRPGNGRLPLPGDVVSYSDGGYGHTNVVVGTGNGTFTTIDENFNGGTTGNATWTATGGNGQSIVGWLHVTAPAISPVRGIALSSPGLFGTGKVGYYVTGEGLVRPFGGAVPVKATGLWSPGSDMIRGLVLRGDGKSGYTLDLLGGIHPFAAAGVKMPATPTVTGLWPSGDMTRGIVLRSDGRSGYTLDLLGGIHPFAIPGAQMPSTPTVTGFWSSGDMTRGIVLRSDGLTGYTLDLLGGVHPFAVPGVQMPPTPTVTGYWTSGDMTRGLVLRSDGTTGYVLDLNGGIHPFAAPGVPMPVVHSLSQVWPGQDVARGIAFEQNLAMPNGTGLDVSVDGKFAYFS